MDVDPGYKYIENISGSVTWYMVETKYVFSSTSFKLKNEKKSSSIIQQSINII